MKKQLGVSCVISSVAAALLLNILVAGTATAGDSGTTKGTVLKTAETLIVRTEGGEEVTFFVQWKKKGEGLVREEMADIALKKALRPGIPVTVKWSVGEKARKYIDKLSATGTITGTVVEPREKGILLVNVDGIEGPMRFVSRWINPEGKWIPDPKEVELIASVPTGAKVSVSYDLEEHFRINKLTTAGK